MQKFLSTDFSRIYFSYPRKYVPGNQSKYSLFVTLKHVIVTFIDSDPEVFTDLKLYCWWKEWAQLLL